MTARRLAAALMAWLALAGAALAQNAIVSAPRGQVSALRATGVTSANSSLTLPANSYIVGIAIVNTTANAITGGVKVGTTSGAIDVVVALAVGANAITFVADAALLKRSFTSSQQLFIDAVTSFNAASINVTIYYAPL